MQVILTGGAGFIGSHVAKELANAGYEPVVLDNLRAGHRYAAKWGSLEVVDLSDRKQLRTTLTKYHVDTVIHFAGMASVAESMTAPAEYFRNNIVNTMNLLDAIQESGICNFIFSSSCSTYGTPQYLPMDEHHPQKPTNPYGETKLAIERMLRWYGEAYRLAWTSLRYFNAAGADADGEVGEDHAPETHIIPRAIAAACGDIPELEILGIDYETHDGTAVRDYIHVTDLASAHVQAMLRLSEGKPSVALNLGTGRGHSVLEVVAMVEKISGLSVPLKFVPRRNGDPSVLIADASSAESELGWIAGQSNLENIVRPAWRWYRSPVMTSRRERSAALFAIT
jgi:UDP-glucose-4-epimerase GalE